MSAAEAIATRHPRNPWGRLEQAMAAAGQGDFRAALAALEQLRHHPEVPARVLEIYRRRLEQKRRLAGAPPRIDTPADYLSNPPPGLHPPFRRLDAAARYPRPFPDALALPPLPGVRNDARFIFEAAAAQAHARSRTLPCPRIHVAWQPAPEMSAAEISDSLTAQSLAPAGVTLFGAARGAEAALRRLAPVPGDVIAADMHSAEAGARLAEIATGCDLVVLLSGRVVLDSLALARLAHPAAISGAVVQPLEEAPATAKPEAFETAFTSSAVTPELIGRYPFRAVSGLNMAVPAGLLRRAGGPDPRFEGPFHAGRELAFRLFRLGAYFVPLRVPALARYGVGRDSAADRALAQALCPTAWDRKQSAPPAGGFDVPRVSIYIPAYNAARYLGRAIDSVLAQDYRDLEVCIADDGSRDATRALLEGHYADEPRVRWQSAPNGGIGHASNRAIAMTRGLYVGQLDSDDQLKPGAVGRLVEVLDADPDLACAYGSAERVNAEGHYLQDEYSWPDFSREKMLLTSIVHHFRMFRRAAFERTGGFREDIVNAVDYDIFLKLSETGGMHHVDEKMYQRRWHGENTSDRNEGHQTENTHRVQRAALRRLGLARFWQLHVPDPSEPRRVSYRRDPDRDLVLFWPDYTRSNPYQRLLYARAGQEAEIVAGDLAAARRALDAADPGARGQVIFHLHWLNFLFRDLADADAARAAADAFLQDLRGFCAAGGRLVWTVHNTLSHNSEFATVEADLSTRIARLADRVHLHSAASLPEVRAVFDMPEDRLAVSPHGHYRAVYPDFVTRAQARATLGLDEADDVILFAGQLRPYKGVEDLIAAFRKLLVRRPRALLLIAGAAHFDPLEGISPPLSSFEASRIRLTRRFLDDFEMQLFFRAADFGVFPYRHILTSGSLMLALGFGLPVLVPDVGMTREVLGDGDGGDASAGVLLPPGFDTGALRAAMQRLLAAKDAGTLPAMSRAAEDLAGRLAWPDFTPVLTFPAREAQDG